jgi:hypothetical protein
MASQEPIFRTVDVGTGQSITLGEPLSSEVKALMQPAGPNRWQMREGTFGHAASIVVQLSQDETVQNIQFGYASGTDYQALVQVYSGELGPPAQSSEQSAVWQDRQTLFEVYTRGNVGSLLSDLVGASS